ncbi:MAG: hemerythrin-like metal-binding protein [Candidatus Omnitrophota bacterium]|jgi:hemerythrin-like metal-binding protein
MKKEIHWKLSYSVGVLDLDVHHQGLIEYMNILDNAENYKQDLDEMILKTLNDLSRYTQYHFDQEESYMRRHDYPGLNEHLEEHALFKNEIENFSVAYKLGDKEIALKVASFLKTWFIKHILTIDKQYSDYYKERGISV